MVRIVAISDTHNQDYNINLPDGDILVHAGDLTGRGSVRELNNVAEWFRSLEKKFKYRIVVAGNHDFGLQDKKLKLWELFDNKLIYLDNRYIKVMGIGFYGSAYTPKFYDWAFMKPDMDLAPIWEKITEKTNVLITHGPPYTILDKNKYGESCGSVSLYNRVKELPNLKYHIFGHIHEGYGQEKIDKITFINASQLNANYEVVNSPVVIDYEK